MPETHFGIGSIKSMAAEHKRGDKIIQEAAALDLLDILKHLSNEFSSSINGFTDVSRRKTIMRGDVISAAEQLELISDCSEYERIESECDVDIKFFTRAGFLKEKLRKSNHKVSRMAEKLYILIMEDFMVRLIKECANRRKKSDVMIKPVHIADALNDLDLPTFLQGTRVRTTKPRRRSRKARC